MIEASSMAEDQQPPGEAAAMAEDQQKPGEAAAMAMRYPMKEVAEAVAFLKETTASLEAVTGVRDGVFQLIAGLGKGGCGGDARAVASRVAGLLGAHPDVLGRFTALFTSDVKATAAGPPEPPLAVTRPRRSRGRSLPAVKEEPDAQDYGSPPRKGEAGGAGGHGGRKRDDPRKAEACAFLNRLLEIAGEEVYQKFLAVLNLHAGDHQFVDVIYGEAKEALGSAHAALLGEFATTFLPGQKEWEKEQARGEARREAERNRRRAATARRAADNQRPARADDGYYDGNHRQHGLRGGGESSGGGGGGGTAARGEFDRQHATLEVVKKRRADGGDHRGHDDDNYAPRFRNKKPRADDGGGGQRRHAVSNNGEPSGSGVAVRALDAGVHGHGDKKPRRRAANGGGGSSAAAAAVLPPGTEQREKEALYRRFRQLSVFYTRYSTLVETIACVKELLRGGGGGGFPASVEEMFPCQEHRELLGSYYGGRWGEVRAALEDGERTGAALKAVQRRLKRREKEAVAEEARQRRRNDPERAAERLDGLVADRVRHEEQDAGDGGAGASSEQHACPRR